MDECPCSQGWREGTRWKRVKAEFGYDDRKGIGACDRGPSRPRSHEWEMKLGTAHWHFIDAIPLDLLSKLRNFPLAGVAGGGTAWGVAKSRVSKPMNQIKLQREPSSKPIRNAPRSFGERVIHLHSSNSILI